MRVRNSSSSSRLLIDCRRRAPVSCVAEAVVMSVLSVISVLSVVLVLLLLAVIGVSFSQVAGW